MTFLRNVFFQILSFLLLFMHLGAMEVNDQKMISINEIPEYYTALTEKLSKQTQQDDENRVGRKLPSFVDWYDDKIIEILNTNAPKFLKDALVHSFHNSDMKTRELAYTLIVGLLKRNWKKSNSKELPDMWCKKSESEWDLFIEKQELDDESCLMIYLIKKLAYEEMTHCGREFGKSIVEYH